jgi:hypothetical protein
MWESDYGISISQQGSLVKDLLNNPVRPKAAKIGLRFGSTGGLPAIDPLHGRAIAAVYGLQSWNTDGTPGTYANQAPFGVDWIMFDYTRAPYRWQGGAILGSATPLPGALAIGGGYLSATNTTVSLDTAGKVCTGATVAAVQGGANCYLGMVCIDDNTGTQVVVTGVDGAVSPRIGAATTVSLIPRTGQSHNAEIPTNPVQFRPMGNPLTFLAPGPTGPKLNLTWTAPTTLALQPGGGTTTFGGPVSYTATGGTTSRSAQDRAADVVNVKDFGANGDGVTNDTTAIQAALNAVPATGARVLWPPGNYIINATLLVSSHTFCYGPGATITAGAGFVSGSTTNWAMMVNKNYPASPTNSYTLDSDIHFHQLSFSYVNKQNVAGGGTHAIRMRCVTRVTVIDCNFAYGNDGTAFIHCDDTAVEMCRATAMENAAFDHWEQPRSARVINNYATVTGPAIPAVLFNASDGTRTDARDAQSLIVMGNVFYGSIGFDTLTTAGHVYDVKISGNYINTTGPAIVARGGVVRTVIKENTLTGTSGTTSPIWIDTDGTLNPSDTMIAGNTIFGVTVTGAFAYAIRLLGGATVSGNRVSGTYDYALSAASGTYVGSGNLFTPGAVGTYNGFVPQVDGQGISFGSVTAANPQDLSKHIALYGTQYGIGVQSGSMFIQASAGLVFNSGATRIALLSSAGNLTATGYLQTGDVNGPTWTTGNGAPSSTQAVGSLYSNKTGAVGATLYVSRGAGTWNPVAGV